MVRWSYIVLGVALAAVSFTLFIRLESNVPLSVDVTLALGAFGGLGIAANSFFNETGSAA